jgi:hypothetical protein
MPKKRVAVSLRKPSPAPEAAADTHPLGVVARIGASDAVSSPVEAATIEAFVSGVAEALERAVSEAPSAQLENLIQRGPDGHRELTLYLPEQLAEDLSRHCDAHALDLNQLLATLVERHLSGAGASVRERLSTAARALLGEVARRVQALVASRRRAWSAGPSASAAATAG